MGVSKKIFAVICIVFLVGALAGSTLAQDRGEISKTYNGKKVSISYGQPELKGRDMLGKATAGMVWRFGMNQATSLTTEATLKFGAVDVPAGSYSLFAKKTDAGWDLIISKATGGWGTSRDESLDLPGVAFEVGKTDSPVEKFTIELGGEGSQGNMKAMWGDTALAIGFEVK